MNSFQEGVDFDDIIQLYIFDKKLRQLMLDAIERIEIQVRSVMAHEMGNHNPLAYQDDRFVNPRELEDFGNQNPPRNIWREWTQKQGQQIERSKEECILWHKTNYSDIPIWVAIEAWDFGTVSKYFEVLKRTYQHQISKKLGISNSKILKNWLQAISVLRNRCAHHIRIWNQTSKNPVRALDGAYFQKLDLDDEARKRIYGLICVLWFLVQNIGPSSQWLNRVAKLIGSRPNSKFFSNKAMGIPGDTGFPSLDKFLAPEP